MRPFHCLIYGGTSSVVAPLVHQAPEDIEFTLLSRSTTDPKKLLYIRDCVSLRPSTRFISYDPDHAYDAIQNISYDVVLVLTTHPDPKVLVAIQCPILFIGSGAVRDAERNYSKWTDYSLGKLWPERFASLTLRCGFFIPDIESEYVPPPAGLGMESAKQIFGSQVVPDSKWLEKKMYVTPMSSLIQVIYDWIIVSNGKGRLSGIFHFGTQHPLSRAFLRMQADLPLPSETVLEPLNPVYEEEWNKSKRSIENVPDTMRDIGGACKRAKAWLEGIV
jgi:hypothetical protein